MSIPRELRNSLIRKYGTRGRTLDRDLLEQIIDEIAHVVSAPQGSAPAASPFDVSWMDSYLAHWTLGRNVAPTDDRFNEVAQMLRDAMDARFEEHKAAILERLAGTTAEAPDGGSPEPGGPPVGPSVMEPDGGPPEPGTPPVGPEAGFLGDNPWILYWFVSLKAPMLLDVIDAHLTRRLSEMGFEKR